MKERSKAEAACDIAMSAIPIVGAVYHGRKNHKEGFLGASEIYEKKYRELVDQKRQIRRDVFGEEQVFICPEAWDGDFWQKKMEVFVKEQIETDVTPRELLASFLQFCIDNFPARRLAQTLEDLKIIRTVILATPSELTKIDQEDIELAIDFLRFYKESGDIKKLKEELVSIQPNTNGCNFLVLGKTGVGKSSLLNSLLGTEKFAAGTGRPVTSKGIHEQDGELDGIKVRVYDSWGLEAGEVAEWQKMLKDAQEKHDVSHKVEDWFHAVVYCVSAGSARVEDVDTAIIRSLLNDDLYVVVALTKADQCSAKDADALRRTLCDKKNGCEKLSQDNVIETCVGAETRSGKTDPFGIPELKRAILANYKKTIQAQLPSRCIHLALQEISKFKEETEDWIVNSCTWKYNENDNNRPLKLKCDEFVDELLKKRFPTIVQEELSACAKFGRNLAATLKVDDIEGLVPSVPSEMGFWESVGNWFAKTIKFLTPWGKSDTEAEQDRLKGNLDRFCKVIEEAVEKQRPAIAKKVLEVLK